MVLKMNQTNSNPTSVNYKYYPVGSSEKLQKDIANKIAGLLAMDNGATLEELGFLGSTVLADRSGSQLVVKLMFHPKLAAREMKSEYTSEVHFTLDKAFSNLKNYMFVGDVSSEYVVSFESCKVPKHAIDRVKIDAKDSRYVETQNKVKRNMLVFDYDGNGQVTKNTVDCDCIVITCNPNLVFAYLVDTSLMDPNYELHVEPVKRPAKVARPNAVGSLVPAFITVTRSDPNEGHRYSEDEAVPYLKQLAASNKNKEAMKRNMSRNAREDADKNPNKVKNAKNDFRKKDKKLKKFSNL